MPEVEATWWGKVTGGKEGKEVFTTFSRSVVIEGVEGLIKG